MIKALEHTLSILIFIIVRNSNRALGLLSQKELLNLNRPIGFSDKRLIEAACYCLPLCSDLRFPWWIPVHILTRAHPSSLLKSGEIGLAWAIWVTVYNC